MRNGPRSIQIRPIYTVEFNTSGRTAIEAEYVEEGGIVEEPENAHKVGYVFDGRTLNNVAEAFPYTVNANITFNAEYTVIPYEIEYQLDGGENNQNNVGGYTVEQEIILNNPTKVG